MPDETGNHTLSISNDAFDTRLKRFLPKEGWYSREELISSLRIAFMQRPVVVLYGENGSGKTTSAAAFAFQEMLRGSFDENPIIYSSFQQIDNLTDLLESFGQVYEIALLKRNIDWRTLDDFQRLKLTQDVLKKVPLLWIWDDFELLGANLARQWLADEKRQLAELLHSIPESGGRILILSSGQEQSLLSKIPGRVQINLEIRNPLSREIISSLETPSLSPEPGLPEVLNLVVSHFSEQDQKIVLMMGLFKGLLSQDILCWMADEKNPWRMADPTGWDRENVKRVLDKAAEFNLCTAIPKTGYYLLHPAVTTWLSKNLTPDSLRNARRAFTQSIANFARQSVNSVQAGNHEVIDLLAVHEANLRQALAFADHFRWRGIIMDFLYALRLVFLKSRRYAAWNRLLDHASRHFIHPDTLQPVSHKDHLIKNFLTFQVEISLKRDRFSQAARWQSVIVMADRKQKPGGGKANSSIDDSARKTLELASSLVKLGEIYRLTASPKSIEAYVEAFHDAKEIGDTRLAVDCACKIAEAYLAIPVAQNLDHAETWIQAGLEMTHEQDDLLRSRLAALRGKAAYENFMKARKANQPINEQVDLLNQALDLYFQALDLVPDNDPTEKGRLHEMIGLLYLQSEGMLETAVDFYDLAIDEMDQAGDPKGAARASFNLAISLFMLNDFQRSRQYGQAALHTYEEQGVETIVEAEKTRKFLARFPTQEI